MHASVRTGHQRPKITASRTAFLCWLTGLGLVLFSTALPASVHLKQADGTALTLERQAVRVITLAPHLTELAFAAGAGNQLIATVEFSEYPPAAAALPRIGDAFRLDLERILALGPDLVIAWQSGNPQQAISRLQSLGIPVWTIEIRRPQQIAATLEQIGRATGNADAAHAAAQRARQKLARLSKRYAGRGPVSYFYQVASNPLYTINGDHLISRGLALCGGQNIFEQQPGLAPQVSREAVIAADPQALLAASGPGQQDPLAPWRDWPGVRAVSHQAMILLPADEISRATPRMLDALATACAMLDRVREEGEKRPGASNSQPPR